MPIIVANPEVAGGRSVVLPGLPAFNAADPSYKINTFGGWFDGLAPSPVLVSNGGGPGAVAVGDWEPVEHYYTIVGRIDLGADRTSLATFRRMLLGALPIGREVSIACHGNGLDADLQVFAMLYDRPEMTVGQRLDFSLPLVAPDPYKYALEPLTGDVGAFVSQTWFRNYVDAAGTWVRRYAEAAGVWSRGYQQAVPDGPYPTSLTVTSPGDALSRRVTVTVAGPLTAGDWRLRNESTGEEMWVDLSVLADQELVLDSAARTARLNGEDVDHLVFGDFLSLAPGDNLFRLATGSTSDAHASVSALPAYL